MKLELTSFIKYVNEEHLIADGQRVLLAVSGGRDSVTLLDLMSHAGYCIGVAHCNFHLRLGDCDRDEEFVRNLADIYGVPCFVAQFDTRLYASEHSLSLEEAARKLRYAFFEEVRIAEGYDLVATAHHRDDAMETFFINLLRGTGITGLCGIPQRNGNVIRPLLAFGRDEINAYVEECRLSYVEDYTNAQTVFLRNRIRHQLMPLLRELSPSFDDVMADNMHNLADIDKLYCRVIERKRSELINNDNKRCHVIDIGSLRKEQPLGTILFELLRPFGFNSATCAQIVSSLDAQSGKQFFSPTHILLKDRDRLIITKNKTKSEDESGNRNPTNQLVGDEYLIYDYCEEVAGMKMTNERHFGKVTRLPRNEALFDRSALHFPLLLRRWHEGDRFRPFGMKGTRLVSDLFSDLKLSLFDKDNAWLLCDGNPESTIIWVVGYRAADYAVVSDETTEVVRFKV